MTSTGLGLLVIAVGAVLVLVGLLGMTGAFSWFGRLPGDLHIEGDRVQVFFPVGSMLLLSVVLTLLFAALRRLL
jgi:hypothetical protein